MKKIRMWWKRNRNVPDTRAFTKGDRIYLGYDYVFIPGSPIAEEIRSGAGRLKVSKAVHRWGDDWKVISGPSSSAQ